MTAMQITTATRQGTDDNNADATAVFTSASGTTAACIVDMIGHADSVPTVGQLLAETAIRIGAQRGALAGLLAAGMLVADPGGGEEPEPDGVAILAITEPGEETILAFVGDCRAYSWDGETLSPRTDRHTMGEFLRWNQDVDLAPEHDNWVRTSLAKATPTSVALSAAPAGELLILMSDGVDDQVDPEVMVQLVRDHHDDPDTLATALVTAAQARPSGRRDDATAIILAP
ncbi:PP2C family serine/threonine-protein phosphatase [Streptomyces sp. NPDC055078]